MHIEKSNFTNQILKTMRKFTLRISALLMFLAMGSFAMAQFNVTFNVDMTAVEGFDPAVHDVFISGSIFDWTEPGSNDDFKMLPSEEDPMIYTISAEMAEAGEIQYKYFSTVLATGWAGGEWEGDPNRKAYAVAEASLNDLWADMPYAVTFNVDMSAVEGFDPAVNTVCMAGTINVANNWQEPGTDPSLMMMASEGNDMIFTLTLLLNDGEYFYKYFSDVVATGWAGGEWEGDPNRNVMVSGETVLDEVWGVIGGGDESIICDFEDGTSGPLTLHVMACGEWDDPELHPVDETFFVIDNPDPTGINMSSKVMQFDRRGTDDGGQPWGGFWANALPEVDVTTHKYLHIMVWKPRISPIKFKLEGGTSGTLEQGSTNPQELTDQWVDYVFDFTTMEGTYPIVAFMPDFEDPLTATGLVTLYFDNIRINSDPEPYDNTGINDVKLPAITIGPNPCNSTLNVKVNENMETLAVYNLLGQQQMIFNQVNTGDLTINTGDLTKGIYILVLRNKEGNTETVKFLKN